MGTSSFKKSKDVQAPTRNPTRGSPSPKRTSVRARVAAGLASPMGRLVPSFLGKRLRNPYFIVGCGRSGTTLLTQVLATHEAIAVYPNEANELWHKELYPWHERTVDLPPIWIDPRGFTKISLARLEWSQIRSAFGGFQYAMGKPIFLNKSVMITFMLKEIAQHFPEARFIHLYRDGRAVALSYATKFLSKIKKHPHAYASFGIYPDFESLVVASFQHWMDHLRAIELADSDQHLSASGRLMELSYERLCEHGDEALDEVLEFMRLRSKDGKLVIPKIDNRNHKVFAKLSPRMLQQLEESGKSALQRKGYALS